MITLDQLRAIMPLAGKRAQIFLLPLNRSMEEFAIDTPPRQAMYLANLAHESGSLIYMKELASGEAYNDRADLGNTCEEAIRIAAGHGSRPGPFWKGRGPIQITGFDNYAACSERLYGDRLHLLHHPEILEIPLDGCRASAWFWWKHGINNFADAGDFDGACDAINRGHKTRAVGDANGYADRLAFYERARKVLA